MVDHDRPGAEHWLPQRLNLQALRGAAPECQGCELHQDATQVVFSSGSADARLVLVGEQPGDREDREGEPFVGPAGRVLADALEAAGIRVETVYITNAVKHFRFEERPGGKARIHKKPGVAHIQACQPWLEAELKVVSPDVIVCLGSTAGRAVLGRPVRIGDERGHLTEDPSGRAGTGVLVTTHPSALLRLKGRGGWDEAFAEFVADLQRAGAAADRG